MSRTERYKGRNGKLVEVRYITVLDGSEELDEIVTDGPVHVEVMDDNRIWADINGVHVNFVKKRRLIKMTVKDSGDAELA